MSDFETWLATGVTIHGISDHAVTLIILERAAAKKNFLTVKQLDKLTEKPPRLRKDGKPWGKPGRKANAGGVRKPK